MPWFNHVRALRLWDFERYTDAQATELRQLRDLYTTHLIPVFGAEMPDAFALVTEGNLYYPRYTATTLAPPPATPVPPAILLSAQPYKSFADTLISTLSVYEEGRRQRWFGKGHPNDPTRLFGIFLRNICLRWLSHAPSSATTLRQVTALRQYLEALAREQVFTNEGQGQDSMTVLLHNLATPLILLEKRLQHEISLQSAREHFNEAKNGVSEALSEAAQYLFYALAAKDRTPLPFSLVNMQARVVNKQLTRALETREGLLLRQWIHAPGVTRMLLPQLDAKNARSVRVLSKPISLFGTETPTPLLDEKGRAHPVWRDFLEQARETEARLEASVRKLPSGICPVLFESKALGEDSLLVEAIQLHGLLESLARYQEYLHQCWQLAGFGGDHCVYDQIAEAVLSILTELSTFNQALGFRLEHFQERLDLRYKAALEATAHLEWQANYRKAKASQEKLLGLLKGCDTALTQMIAHTQDAAARKERRALATNAYHALSSAPAFLDQARQQVGLEPKASYPGLAAPDSKAAGAASNPFMLTLAPEQMSIDQVLVVLLPQSPREVAWLSQVCVETPTTAPWSGFRGTYQRYCYLHENTRLKSIGRDLSCLQLNAQTPLTPEKVIFITRLRTQLQEEQKRLTQLSQNLWQPFHRASIRFFAALQQGVTEKLHYLQQFNMRAAVSKSQGSVPTQRLQRLLGPPARDLAEVTPVPATISAPVSSPPLSAETQAKITRIHRRYNQLTLQERASFDTWQYSHFGGSIWDAHGVLRPGLTESEGDTILEAWADNSCQRAEKVLAAHRITEAQLKKEIRALRREGSSYQQ